LYREYGRLVYAVAYKVLGERGLAEEAAQQAFLQAWRGARSFEPTRDLAPWLATIARRAAIDIHRREARRAHERLEDVPASNPAVMTLPESAESIYEVWEVRGAVEELPAEERDVVRLQHLDGDPHTHPPTALAGCPTCCATIQGWLSVTSDPFRSRLIWPRR